MAAAPVEMGVSFTEDGSRAVRPPSYYSTRLSRPNYPESRWIYSVFGTATAVRYDSWFHRASHSNSRKRIVNLIRMAFLQVLFLRSNSPKTAPFHLFPMPR